MKTAVKNNVLENLAQLIDRDRASIIAANKSDLGKFAGGDAVLADRLKVDDTKIDRMIASAREVAAATDPCGRVLYSKRRVDGLLLENRTVPFGTILIVYEARPDVTVEAAAIALKAGNRILLKGGKEACETNLCLTNLWREALEGAGADAGFVRYLDFSREETQTLIEGRGERFDLVIPRGGETLIDFVLKNSNAPVIVSGRGNNFAFVDAEADFDKALAICLDGKSRLSVCNALDKILIDEKLPDLAARIDSLVEAFHQMSVEVLGDASVHHFNRSVQLFDDEETWFEEFLSAKIVIAVVAGIDDAIDRINQYSGGHSATIVTKNVANAARFMNDVDCAAVYHNASTRFTDGGEFGLGAEIAISTQKLHFRGPLGAEHLLTNKWFVFGEGQTRG
jgi:glutamate-5-semialdehyde dehydrogenase